MQSIEVIYRQYASVVYRYLFAKIRDENIAEEVTQETFYQAIRCSDKFDYSCKVSTWLCAIAKNQLAVYLRKNHINDNLEDVTQSQASAEDEYMSKDGQMFLLKQLHSVPILIKK